MFLNKSAPKTNHDPWFRRKPRFSGFWVGPFCFLEDSKDNFIFKLPKTVAFNWHLSRLLLGHHYFLTNVSSMSRSLFFIGLPNSQLHANFSHGVDRVAFMFFKALPSITSNQPDLQILTIAFLLLASFSHFFESLWNPFLTRVMALSSLSDQSFILSFISDYLRFSALESSNARSIVHQGNSPTIFTIPTNKHHTSKRDSPF